MTGLIVRICFTLAWIIAAVYPQSKGEKLADISLPPVSTFHEYCARCHGEEGSAYGKGFGNLTDDSLRAVIEDMMFGPAGLNPTGIEIKAMTTYHKFLRDNKPFATVLNSNSFSDRKEKSLMMDVSPGADLETNDKEIKIQKKRSTWVLTFDPAKTKKVRITITRNGSSSTLDFPEMIWSK